MMASFSWPIRINNVAVVALAASTTLGLGCSDATSGGAPSYGSPTQGGLPPSTLSAECSEQLECDPAGAGLEPGEVCVQTLDTSLVTLGGSPVADMMVTVCGKNLCAKGKSDATGRVHMAICKAMMDPAFELDGKASYVTFAVPLSESIATIPALSLVPLPSQGDDLLSAAQTGTAAQSAGVSLTLQTGTSVEYDMKDAFDPESQRFRAAIVPSDKAPPSAEPSLGLELLVGLAPTRAVLSAPARLSVPNSSGWPAGTTVEFYQHGVDPLGQGPAPFGRFTFAGTGRVGDDGTSISTDTESGISYVATMGIRRK